MKIRRTARCGYVCSFVKTNPWGFLCRGRDGGRWRGSARRGRRADDEAEFCSERDLAFVLSLDLPVAIHPARASSANPVSWFIVMLPGGGGRVHALAHDV